MKMVLDASVAAKCYVDEPGSEEALAVIESAEVLLAPDLVIAEVGNVAWKKVLRQEIQPAHAIRMLQAIGGLFDHLVPSAVLVARAFEIARELEHPVYDALYLALVEAESASLVTDDGRLLRRLAITPWRERIQPLRGWPDAAA